jgi:hypothetical protein
MASGTRGFGVAGRGVREQLQCDLLVVDGVHVVWTFANLDDGDDCDGFKWIVLQ